MKLEEKNDAIRLRKLGKSYGEIYKKLGVSKGTLSLWLRQIKLTSKQKKRLYVTLKQKNSYRLAKYNQQKKKEKTKQIIAEAKEEFKRLSKNFLFITGLMLYWAEGDKSDESEIVKFSNSDPKMIKLMMTWFRKICRVPEERIRIAIHIHELHCRNNIENYWSKLTKVSKKQFHKTQIKPTSLQYRKNLLYDGTCSIRISDKNLFRRIKGWKIAFSERIK